MYPLRLLNIQKKDPDIKISESIEDNRDIYKASEVLVTPIRGPGGTRLKVLESLASGLPIVSTSVGVAGLNLTPGKHALVADDMQKLTENVISVLKDKKLAQKISSQGKDFIRQNFDWKGIVAKLNKVYEETAAVNNNS